MFTIDQGLHAFSLLVAGLLLVALALGWLIKRLLPVLEFQQAVLAKWYTEDPEFLRGLELGEYQLRSESSDGTGPIAAGLLLSGLSD